MKWQTAAKVSVITGASVLLLAACGSKSSSTSTKQTATITESAELPTMDMSKATDTVSASTLNNTNEGLYRLGKDSSLEPGVASAMKVSKDGKTYTFTLRKNAKWSNGDKVTAKDFVYGWQRTVNPKTASQYSYLYAGIKNANKIMKNKAAVSSLGVKAEGDYKLVVSLEQPISYFKLLITEPYFFPQSQKAVQKYGSKYGTNASSMVYNGPYKLTGWSGSNLSWTMVKNKDYWDAKNVKMDSIKTQVTKDPSTSLNLYNSNKADRVYLVGTQVKNYRKNKDYLPRKQASTFYIEYNQKSSNKDAAKAFKNANIRKAMSMIINRKQFVNDVLADGSTMSKGYVSTGLAKNPKTGEDFADQAKVAAGIAYNKSEATKLWNKGMKEVGLKSLNIKLLSDDTDTAKRTTEYLQGQYQKLPGLKVSNQNVPFKTRLQRSQSGNFDTVVSAWGADFSDPISFLTLFTSDNTYNNGKWKNSEYDQLIKDASGKDANNKSKRWDDMVKAEKILMNDQGVAPLYQQTQPTLQRSDLKGIIFNSAGVNWNFKHMYISK